MNSLHERIIHCFPKGKGTGVPVRIADDTQACHEKHVQCDFLDDCIHFHFFEPEKIQIFQLKSKLILEENNLFIFPFSTKFQCEGR